MVIQVQAFPRRKKVLIFISEGGGGHKTAGEALKEILSPDFDVEIVNVIHKALKSIDPLSRLTRGHFSGEDLYNFCLRRNRYRCIQWIATYGAKYITSKNIDKAIEDYLQATSFPDLIISTTPYVNYGIACATRRLRLPFLVIPTDLDGSTFLYGFPSKDTHHDFKFALAYDDNDLRRTTFQKHSLNEHQLVTTGFPVRPACQKKHTENELTHLRKKHGLFEQHQTISLIMGALGGNLIYEHTKALADLDPRSHNLSLQINICVGHNQKMGKKISDYLLAQGAKSLSSMTYLMPSGLIFHLRGFTKDILEIMATSDLIISKTGSCTVNEAIYLGKKLLLDNTSHSTARHLWWESFNVPFVQKHELGLAFTDSRQLHMLIPSCLKYPEKKKKFTPPNFHKNIVTLVKEIIN